MIGNLRGKIIDRGATTVIIECAGVGYEVVASSHTLAQASEMGATVSLRIYTHFQDHKIALYGFSSADERDLFDLLITVKNVGPSSGIKILSAGTGPVAIAQLISAEDVKALCGIKGIGKKTAEMLVVELHDKCDALLNAWGAAGLIDEQESPPGRPSPKGNRPPLHNDVIMALVQLGFRQPEAEKAVDLLPVEPTASLETVMRQALQAIPR